MPAPPPARAPRPAASPTRALAAALAAALVAALVLLLPATRAQAAPVLLSQGRTATASSTENYGTPASNAVDGNTGTRWSSANSDPQWLQVDLGAPAALSSVTLQWEAAYAKGYQIQLSTDGANWTTAYSTTTGAGGTENVTVTGTARYVRMNGTARATGYGYSLWEFQVYGATGGTDPGSCGTANAAQGRTATASSTENYGTPASNAVDGDAGTRWSSAAADPQWLQVDLGSAQAVCGTAVKWESAYAKSYQIQLSTDGANWTTAYSTTTGAGGTETQSFAGTARYVRLNGTVRATGYGYSVWEFQVFTGSGGSTGTPTTPPPSTTPPGNWTTVFSDNFAGGAGSAPNSANWTVRTGTAEPGGSANWGTGEIQTDTAANAVIDGNGHLNLTAVRDGSGKWTSGRVESVRGDFAAPAGGQLQISAQIKQPGVADGTGYWPSFRAIGANDRSGGWPGTGETDILENVNGRSQTSATLHCGTAPGGNCNEYNGMTSGLASCPGCQSDYHTYSQIIDRTVSDEQIRWYLDGRQIWQVNESQVGTATWQAAVDHGFKLLFNLGIGGSFPDSVCGCTTPTAATTSGGALSIGTVTVSTTSGAAPAPLADPPAATGRSTVKVTGSQGNWKLTVNGQPYQLKGVTWGPAQATADAHMRDLKAMGVNTVRTWGTDAGSKPLLDSAAAYGLRVVNGFWLNQGADYVNDTAYKTSTLDSIKQWVTTYKDHPGTLMWDVGNEVILTTQDHAYNGATVEQERVAYAQYVEQVVQAIHAIDPDHPVTSTDAYTGAWTYYKQYTPSLDLLAVNSYGAVCNVKQDWISGGYTKPYIVTESGDAGEWEVPGDANGVPTQPTDTQKRDGYTSAWNCIAGHTGVSLGATMFNYGTENDFGGTWFNLIPGGWKQPAYYAVAKSYGGSAQSGNTPPVTGSVTLSRTADVPAGGAFTVSAPATDPDGDLVRYQLYYSSKYVDGGTGFSQVRFTQTGDGQFTVTAPKTLGVWKVYVYAFDGHGNVGIESRSFRTVAPTPSGTNVAKGRPTTASTYQAVGNGAPYPPTNATDGNWSTRWASEWADPQWIQVDLGQATQFKHVQLGWESAYGKAYQVQTSNDGANWTTVYTQAAGTGGIDDVDVNGNGRYVRVTITQRGTAYGDSLYEFGVYA
ncbi:discoidin domain-containing protein [Streptomyces sp. TLI_171]|uniref:discoidin domain-containing protein n=1 Tax=Streptomyces sp. TLI_171 TaxID=1938859 RepID=UPI000C19A0B6|nr:discoidin domain-containing protein [Streptomyces sp. TLI_171]RKE16973.1 glycosyl hydrolase family 2 [Streptomyces sp. TLI_171]